MDWRLSFIPNDVSDMTARQASTKVNPKVVLNLKIGKGKLMLSKDLVTEDITFAGLMRIRLKLMNNFPHVQVVDLSFLEKPVIDFVAKPIGFDLDIIPGLEGFIHNQLHAILGPMMYDPNVFTINLEQLLASAPIDTAIGVLAITVHNARGLKGVKLGGGLPDPYVILSLGARSGLGKTPIKHSTVNPHWNDTKFLLVNSLNESLNMTVMDYNDRRKDSELGAAVFDMKSLQEDPEQEELNTDVLLAGKARGSVKYTVKFFPVLTPKKLADGTEETLPESSAYSCSRIIGQSLTSLIRLQKPVSLVSRCIKAKTSTIAALEAACATLTRESTFAGRQSTRLPPSSGTIRQYGSRTPSSSSRTRRKP